MEYMFITGVEDYGVLTVQSHLKNLSMILGWKGLSADAKLKLQICLLGVSRDVSVLVSHVDPSANVSSAAVVVLLAYRPIVSISCSSGGPDPGLLETCPAS